MKIQTIYMEGQETPQAIQVDMTIDEAILIASYVGDVVPSTETSTGIWDELSGGLFNRFWEDGLHDARGERRTATRTA
jgi:hypothetical protein